eukprot:12020781-Karenia_brevis.AAC.1
MTKMNLTNYLNCYWRSRLAVHHALSSCRSGHLADPRYLPLVCLGELPQHQQAVGRQVVAIPPPGILEEPLHREVPPLE